MRIGADVDQLDRLANAFAEAADRLQWAVSGMDRSVASSPWRGRDAAVFAEAWERWHARNLLSVASRLRDASGRLRSEASAQRRASAARPVFTWPSLGQMLRFATRTLAAPHRWARDEGLAQIALARSMSPADQRAWWGRLESWQRQALLAFSPGALTGLAGLPEDVLADARHRYVQSQLSELAQTTDTLTASGEVDIAWVEIAAELQYRTETMADGSVVVTFRAEGSIGAQLGEKGGDVGGGELKVAAGAGVETSYRFSSEREAQEFVDGLQRQLRPSGLETGLALVPFVGASLLAGDTASDISGYLNRFDSKLESRKANVELSGEGKVSLAGGELEIRGAMGAEHDFVSGETSLYLEVEGEAAARLGVIGGEVEGEARLALTVGPDHELRSVSIDVSLEATGGGDLKNSLRELGIPNSYTDQAGGRANLQGSIALDDPLVANEVRQLLQAVNSGDPGASADAIRELYALAEVKASVEFVTERKTSFDVVVVSGELEAENRLAVAHLLKPSQGSYIVHQPQRSDVPGGSGW